MRDMGLFGVTMPEEYGGAGMNVSQYVGFIRELAYASPAYRSIVSINIGMVCKSLIGFGTEQQKAHWLPKLAAGSIAAFGLTEPDSGSDSAAMKTRAVQRSEEHTSELQSLMRISYAVFCVKKKKTLNDRYNKSIIHYNNNVMIKN